MEVTGKNLKITIENGIITDIRSGNKSSSLYISPRFIDLHCHLREPGQEEKETLQTGINSAFHGGYGTIFAMPNTNPVCDNIDTLNYILTHSKNCYNLAVKPICAITTGLGGNKTTNFKELAASGAGGFSNDGKPVEDMEVLKKAITKATELNLLIISHAENTKFPPQDSRSEWTAVEREIQAVRETGGKLHFAHISTKESIELIGEAKKEGLKITAETAPHYFTLSKNDINTTDGRFKMNPPLRDASDVEAVKTGLKNGIIDIIATDHAPHTNNEKLSPYDKSPFGITGFETAFPLGYTNLVLNNILSIDELINKLVYAPAKIAGINVNGLQLGAGAEFNIIDISKKYTVTGENLKTKCKITPYEGMELTGKVVQTVIGNQIYDL